jgi:molybdate transport system permease protein
MDWSPLWISLRVAFCATLFSTLLGLPVGYALAKRRVPGRAVWEGLILLPLVLPPTVLGYYLLTLLGQRSVPGRVLRSAGIEIVFTWQGAVVAACAVSLPLLARGAQAAFAAIESEYLEVARTMGATEGQAFRYVLLPLALPGVLAGMALAFARALGDFGTTLMVAGDIPGLTRTMPLAVYSAVNAGNDRAALSFVLLLSAVCLCFSFFISFVLARANRASRDV